jgi:hypothetical protein
MNLDPETLFSLRDKPTPAPAAVIDSKPDAANPEAGSGQMRSDSIVGDHFFWASSSALVDLS